MVDFCRTHPFGSHLKPFSIKSLRRQAKLCHKLFLLLHAGTKGHSKVYFLCAVNKLRMSACGVFVRFNKIRNPVRGANNFARNRPSNPEGRSETPVGEK